MLVFNKACEPSEPATPTTVATSSLWLLLTGSSSSRLAACARSPATATAAVPRNWGVVGTFLGALLRCNAVQSDRLVDPVVAVQDWRTGGNVRGRKRGEGLHARVEQARNLGDAANFDSPGNHFLVPLRQPDSVWGALVARVRPENERVSPAPSEAKRIFNEERAKRMKRAKIIWGVSVVVDVAV